MFEGLLAVLILILSLVGLTELLHRAWVFVLRPSAPQNTFLLSLLWDDTAAQRLRADLEIIRWSGRKEANLVLAVDCGLSEEDAAVCRTIAEQNSDVIYCACADLPATIKQLKDAQHVGTDGNKGASAGNR